MHESKLLELSGHRDAGPCGASGVARAEGTKVARVNAITFSGSVASHSSSPGCFPKYFILLAACATQSHSQGSRVSSPFVTSSLQWIHDPSKSGLMRFM